MDTFSDSRRGYELIVSPYGVQADLIRGKTNTNNGKTPAGTAWEKAPASSPIEGYDVEIASTLRFPTGGGEQTWGISLFLQLAARQAPPA